MVFGISLNVSAGSAPLSASLESRPVVVEKSDPVIAPAAAEYLRTRDRDTCEVWIFFRDKGVRTAAQFSAAASQVVLTERTARRRERTGSSEIRFADLPVVQTYVDQVSALGATHRRSSRWLNAASFSIP